MVRGRILTTSGQLIVQTLDPTKYEPIANPVLIRVALKVQEFIDHDEITWGNPRAVPDGTVQPLF
jgi:hypothetical protein